MKLKTVWKLKYSGAGNKRLWNIYDDMGQLLFQTRDKETAKLAVAAPDMRKTILALLDAFDQPHIPLQHMANGSALKAARKIIEATKP